MPLVLVEAAGGGIAAVTLNRPEKRNALSVELRVELADALDRVAADPGVRCVVLTGAGSAFCAGMDVTQFGGDAAHKRTLVETSERLFATVGRFPLPLVAAVNGPAVAGGFALALLCDLRVAAPEATFGFPEVGRDIPPSYAAARAALAPAVAADLCLTGRLVDVDEALALGIAQRRGDRGVALEEAAVIASAPGAATREVKRRILLERDHALEPLFEDERRALQAALLG